MMIEELIKAAKEENWDLVDSEILEVANDPRFIDWAKEKGLSDDDENVRDLAVSLLEKTNDLDEPTMRILYSLMFKDSNTYVRFRSAFALKKHGYEKHPQEVIAVLRQAAQDIDTKNIAEGYLKQ
tara:strand:- start:2420 stop:2794 length:375 start_codon:yes stop_codon:yes gene_type:complete